MSFSAATAKAIIEKAIEDDSYSGKKVPADDAKAIKDAEELIDLARDAAKSFEDDEEEVPEELAEIIALADADEGDEDEPEPKPKAGGRAKPGSKTKATPKGSTPKPAPEADFSDDPRASDEPYEKYDDDSPKEIADSLEPAVDEDEDDGLEFLEHTYVYEVSNKNRKRITDEALRLLAEHHEDSAVLAAVNGEAPAAEEPEATTSGDPYTQEQLEELEKEDLKEITDALGLDFPKRFTAAGKTRVIDAILEAQEGGSEPEPDADQEPEPDAEPAEAPFDDYDDWTPKEIKEVLTGYIEVDEDEPEDERDSDEDKLAVLEQTILYESQNKNRKSLISFFEEQKEVLTGAEEPSAEEAGEDGEGEDADAAAASDDDSAGEDDAPKRTRAGKKAGAAAGTRKKRDRSSEPEDDEGDEEYGELIEHIRDKVERENLHVPAPIEDEDKVELPFDLTSVSEVELQRLHSAFSYYSYRVGHLLAIAEAHAHAEKNAADEIVDAAIASMEGDVGVTLMKAIAEQETEVITWRKRQRRHEVLASFLRRERDNYDKTVDRLSRQITARDDEWRHSSTPGNKARPARSKS